MLLLLLLSLFLFLLLRTAHTGILPIRTELYQKTLRLPVFRTGKIWRKKHELAVFLSNGPHWILIILTKRSKTRCDAIVSFPELTDYFCLTYYMLYYLQVAPYRKNYFLPVLCTGWRTSLAESLKNIDLVREASHWAWNSRREQSSSTSPCPFSPSFLSTLAPTLPPFFSPNSRSVVHYQLALHGTWSSSSISRILWMADPPVSDTSSATESTSSI